MKTLLKLFILFLIPFISNAQNVGIGTDTPTATLHVKGNVTFKKEFEYYSGFDHLDPLSSTGIWYYSTDTPDGSKKSLYSGNNPGPTIIELTYTVTVPAGKLAVLKYDIKKSILANDILTLPLQSPVTGPINSPWESVIDTIHPGTHTLLWKVQLTSAGLSHVYIDNLVLIEEPFALRLETGSEGLGKILISDSLGNVDWEYMHQAIDIDVLSDGIHTDNTLGLGHDAGTYPNTSSINNIAIGDSSLANNGSSNTDPTKAHDNIAIGSKALKNNTIGYYNIAIGTGALEGNTNKNINLAIGYQSLNVNKGYGNSAIGYHTLKNNNFGTVNAAFGLQALEENTNGTHNTAIGGYALKDNLTGLANTAVGALALIDNTTGGSNTALGVNSLYSNTIGSSNVGLGRDVLYTNISGYSNIAIGTKALYYNTTESNLLAIGDSSLFNNTGNNNVALGSKALFDNTTGGRNVALGFESLYKNNGDYNVAIGYKALNHNISGNDNTAIGDVSGIGSTGIILSSCTFLGSTSYLTTGRTNVTMLGAYVNNGQCTGNNQVLLGSTAVTQIRANVTSITAYSDARFKSNIEENVKGLEFIELLRPVSYNENPEILHQIWGTPDSIVRKIDHSEVKSKRHTGLIAQEVEQAAIKANFDFAGIDIPTTDKEVYSLRYGDFVVPLVKAVQELSEENKVLKAKNETLEARLDNLEKIVLEMNKNK